MTIEEELSNAYARFQEIDKDAGRIGADNFFAYCILNRFTLALEILRNENELRSFRSDSVRDLVSLNKIIESYGLGELNVGDAVRTLEGYEAETRRYLEGKGFYPFVDLRIETYDPEIQLRFSKESFDGDQFEFSLGEVEDLLEKLKS
tara:strand:- start:1523 stop:1966 length:444 start_codon:yes stop_codon:yes gene_type:complete